MKTETPSIQEINRFDSHILTVTNKNNGKKRFEAFGKRFFYYYNALAYVQKRLAPKSFRALGCKQMTPDKAEENILAASRHRLA
jgi:hypothetical protein